jgi:O-antigen/teichoic acid export membrane protein
MPVAGLLTWVATPLSEALWGRAFLPESAIALQILIWFLPLSFVNGLTQYVLIALGLQARITVAFAVAAIFNLVANLVLVPTYGYVAAAATTIATEVVLLVPFALAISTRLPFRPLVMACVRPLPAAMIAGGVLLVGEAAIQSAVPTHDAITSALPAHDAMFEWATVIAAGITYPLALWATRALAPDDLDLMLSVIRRKR